AHFVERIWGPGIRRQSEPVAVRRDGHPANAVWQSDHPGRLAAEKKNNSELAFFVYFIGAEKRVALFGETGRLERFRELQFPVIFTRGADEVPLVFCGPLFSVIVDYE